jgi:hypothetical protein
MAVTSTTLAGVNVWRLSGNVTDAELISAWSALIVNNRYKPARTIYIDDTCSLANVRGTYYVDSENLGVILHLSRNKANTLFKNWFFTQTVGLAVTNRANFVRFTNGTTITNSTVDGIDMQGGGMMYAVVGAGTGGDPRFLNEMAFGSLDGTLVTSAAFTQQEIEPCSIGTIWRGLNIQRAAGYPILQSTVGAARQVIYRSNMNTESATLRLVRPYYNCSVCYVSTLIRRQGAAVTSNIGDMFGSSGAGVVMALNNWLDESWFGASKTAFTFSNWSAGNRVIGGVMKKIQVQPSTLIRTYDSRSTLVSQKSTFSETTNDFLTGDGTTNLFIQSEAIDNAAWEKGAITVTANNTTAPDGTSTADRLVEAATTAQHRTSNVTAIGVIPATAHTFSFYAKPSGRNHVHARIISAGTTTDAQACFDIVNGTSIQSAGTTATITSAGNGWFRCSISATVANASIVGYVNLATTSSLTVPSYAGNTSNGVFLWGMQLESGTTASTYLPTTTTRADGYYSTTADASTGRAQFVSVGGIATGGSQTITRYTGQKYTLQKFGYRVQVETPDMTFGDDDLSAFSPITMTEQDGISRTEAEINAATTIDDFQELLEELHVLAIGLQGSASYSGYANGNLFTFAGGVLTTNFTTVNVDATASSKITYNATTNTITIKSSNLVGNSVVNSWNNSIGAVNLLNGAIIQGVYTTSAGTSTVLELNTPSNGYSLCIFRADGTTKYFASNVTTGAYYVYFAPSEAGTYYLAAENYGQKRTTDTLVLSGGNVWYNITDQEDVGITVTNKATVAAYTTIDNYDEFYDYTAYKRLEETYIKLGQIATRDGLNLNISAPYSVKVNQSAASVYNLASNIFTIKTNTFANGVKFTNMILVPPATLAPTTNELLTGNWEDANGDSSIDIQGALAPFSIYKFPITTPFPSGSTDDRLDPAFLIATITDRKYRFINDPAYNYFVWSASKKSGDNIPNISEGQTAFVAMTKGAYTAYCFQGAEIQLVQAPKVDLIYNDIQSVLLDTDAIKGTGFTKDVNSLTNITEAIETQGTDLIADLTIINNGVKKASIFVPHSQNLS